MAATIIDIARLAGTSKSTVSRYLTGSTVKHETAVNIQQAIKSLQFTPNINARRLVGAKTNTIGVVFDDISLYYYGVIMQGIQDVAKRENYMCNFFSRADARQSESDFLSLFAQGQVDGIIFATFRQRDPAQIAEIAATGLPIIFLGTHPRGSDIAYVDVDNRLGIHQLVLHLYGLGHRQIAYLNGPSAMPASSDRLKGYAAGLKHHALPFNKSLIVDVPWTVEGGESAVDELTRRAQHFTALIGSNEFCTFGASRALQERGLRVPEDVSLAGFDDSPLSQYASPGITTLRQPFLQMGQTAVDHLISKIKDPKAASPCVYLPPQLILRESCAPAMEASIKGHDQT